MSKIKMLAELVTGEVFLPSLLTVTFAVSPRVAFPCVSTEGE